MASRDDEQFAAFVVGHQAKLQRTAYLLVGDWQHARDLAQEALLRMYVAWPRLERTGGLGAYARRTVVSAAMDAKRRRSSTEIVSDTRAEHRSPDPADFAADLGDRDLIVHALRQLPERQRACIVLRYYEDLSVDETAQILGCPSGTVKSATARAIGALRLLLGPTADATFLPPEAEESPSWRA